MINQNNNHKLISIQIVILYIILWSSFSLIANLLKGYLLEFIQSSQINGVGKFISLYEVHNSGAAFNILSNRAELLIIFSIIALIVISSFVVYYSKKMNVLNVCSAACLSGGIMLNMLERINLGYVIDYIYCNFFPNFPVFNLFDIMIVLGAIGLIYSIMKKK